MEFEREYQLELAGKMRSRRFMEEVGVHLRSDMFDMDLRVLVASCLREWREGSRILSKAQFRQLCSGLRVKFTGDGNLDFDRKEVVRYCKYKILGDSLLKAQDLRERGRFESAVKEVWKCGSRFPAFAGNGAPDILRTDLPLTRRRNVTPTGIPSLDSCLGGGVGAGDLGVILAPTSGGKTSLLVWMGAHAVRLGLKVYHVTLELSSSEMQGKYRCCLSGLSRPSRKVWKRVTRKLPPSGSLRVSDHPPGAISVMQLQQEVPRDTDLLIVDYGDDLQTSQGSLPCGYEEFGEIFSDLKRLGIELGVPVWTASQTNRPSYQKPVAGVEDVESSLKKMMRCNQAISINQSEMQRVINSEEECRATLYVAKNSFGPRYVEVPLRVGWPTCSFKEE